MCFSVMWKNRIYKQIIKAIWTKFYVYLENIEVNRKNISKFRKRLETIRKVADTGPE
jgi:hypothetical protein